METARMEYKKTAKFMCHSVKKAKKQNYYEKSNN